MIFGYGYPVVKPVSDTEEEFDEIILKYASIIPDYLTSEYSEKKSELTGERDYIHLNTFTEVEIRVHLFCHENPEEYYFYLKALEFVKVYLRPHRYDRNGNLSTEFIKDDNGNNVEFMVTEFKPNYLNGKNKFDIVDMKLESLSEPRGIIL